MLMQAMPDCKGHSGRIISIGRNGGPVFVKSSKQRLVAKSSTEAELICLSDATSDVVWIKTIGEFLGLQKKPATIFQDNKSTMTLAETGRSKTGNSKHIDVRYFYIKEKLEEKIVRLIHLPSEDMIADMLTKPLQGELFYKLREKLLNLPSAERLINLINGVTGHVDNLNNFDMKECVDNL
jgi:hypothetical protein